jgi:hypothetical protein
MKQFRNLPEMLQAPEPIRKFIAKTIGKARQPFEEALGGNVFLVEHEADLSELTIDHFSGANALETAGAIDIADWIDDEHTYALFFSATNDSGGPGYFVPAHIVQNSGNLSETMVLSSQTKPKRSRKKT